MEGQSVYHVPVLLGASVDALQIHKGGVYADVTFGGGNHSREIMRRIDAVGGGRLFGFDQDADAERNALNHEGFTFVRSNFRYIKNFARYYGVKHFDGILADLGVSWHHFDDSTRGFSFRFDGELDMRMNQRSGTTAADILNNYDEKRLADVFFLYGELRNSRQIAREVLKRRAVSPILTISDLLDLLKPIYDRERDKKELAKVFQALRIEVNHEMDALKALLDSATELLADGGRLVVITYHSLEDRMVKNVMKSGNVDGKVEKDFYGNVASPYRLVNRQVVVPDEQEQNDNPRSRSAKLRVAERLPR
ncbi:MAG: 16S rRNA (cytosine(1402)-N(4))-methyltransferase RsmH [Bacteroidaceae bacterium]|nr:16S rRNA (cytosine(1402)-N(4))-methyltransferase RsmH [Bacteroidaceae bacterium]